MVQMIIVGMRRVSLDHSGDSNEQSMKRSCQLPNVLPAVIHPRPQALDVCKDCSNYQTLKANEWLSSSVSLARTFFRQFIVILPLIVDHWERTVTTDTRRRCMTTGRSAAILERQITWAIDHHCSRIGVYQGSRRYSRGRRWVGGVLLDMFQNIREIS